MRRGLALVVMLGLACSRSESSAPTDTAAVTPTSEAAGAPVAPTNTGAGTPASEAADSSAAPTNTGAGTPTSEAASSSVATNTGAGTPTSEAASSIDAAPVAANDPVQELAPWIRDMFDPTVRRTYSRSFYVDDHGDSDEDEDTFTVKMHCHSDGPTRHELADGRFVLVACQACEFLSKRDKRKFDTEPGIDLDLDECYVANADGLWVVDKPPKNAKAVARIVKKPPYLSAKPEPRKKDWFRRDERVSDEEVKRFKEEMKEEGQTVPHGTERPPLPWEIPMGLEVAELADDVVGKRVPGWCRSDYDGQGYEESTTRCFATGFGLVSADFEGREGPSTEHVKLLEVIPLPAE